MVAISNPPDFACLVLAGGQSRRFGSEKALATLHAKPLLEWTMLHLKVLKAPAAVSARKASATEEFCKAHAWLVIHDAEELPRGALDGVCAGLAWAHVIAKPWLLTLPCDVPLLPENFFERLFASAGEHGAYAQSPKGIEGLCALWPTSALSFLQVAAKTNDQPSIQQCLKDIGAKPVAFDAPLLNANTEGELAEIERVTRVENGLLVKR